MDPTLEDVEYFNQPYHRGDRILKGVKNYLQYVSLQTQGNIEKKNWIYVDQECIKMLAEYLHRSIGENRGKNGHEITFGLCHGTRRGFEQLWFQDFLQELGHEECQVVGTEISTTATEFPNTIQWDFHHVKKEWIGQVDFIYSNSFDHSYDPVHCLKQWMKCLKPGGICIIEWAQTQTPQSYRTVTCCDMFWATQEELQNFIEEQGFILVDILDSDGPRQIIDLIGHHTPISQERNFYIIRNILKK